MMSRTKILIADDHKMFAQGLQGLLEDEFCLVGIVEDGQALVAAANQLDPDVIVVDISMPVMNGLDAVRQLKKQGVTAKILFLTMHADDRLLAEAFAIGGSGYVLKQSAGEELILAIRRVLDGHKYITPRQREVLQLLIEGRTMKEVATRLGISTRTAESHKYVMMEGLGVDNTAE